MNFNKIHLETVNNPGPPPDYASATAIGAPPPPAPYQAPGFQTNTSALTQWYIGAPGSGFHLLDNHEEVIVERMVDLMEAVLSVNTSSLKRQFRVTNRDNQQLLFLEEDESLLSNSVQRAYTLTAKNSHGETVFAVHRNTEHCPCCFCCVQCEVCRSKAKITDSKSECIGTLVQRFHCNAVRFAVEDSDSREVMKINGGNACCTPATFYELAMIGISSRGSITKQGSPWGRALNKYTIKFPPNLDGRLKACCIGAVIHFDFRFHLIQQRMRND